MGKSRPVTQPVEGSRVSNKDVGHNSSSSSTQTDEFTGKNKTMSSKISLGRSAKKTNYGEVSGKGDTTEEDESNGDDEASSDELDDKEADDEEPGAFAPSGGAQKGSQDEDDLDSNTAGSVSPIETGNRQAGQPFDIGILAAASKTKRKRTLSEMTTNTVISTTELDRDGNNYPRKRVDRRLSNTADGLLKYKGPPITDNDDDDFAMTDYEEAIQSSDEEDESTALDQLDDSQDTDVEQLEEALIIEEESARLAGGRHDDLLSLVGRTNDPLDSDDELPADLGSFWSSEMDMFEHADLFLNNHAISDNEDDIDFSTPRPYMTKRTQSDVSARRVRFEDEVEAVGSSPASSAETDLNVFPDLMDGDTFAAQDNLPSSIRDQIENDIDFDIGNASASDTEGSCWDFGEEQASENLFAWHDVHTESESEGGNASGSDLSGYDSDGDTTDDDLPPPSTVRAPKSLLHRRSPSTIHSATATPKPFPRSKRVSKGPVMGSFVVDEKKAMAFIDPRTKQLKIHRARAPFLGAIRGSQTTPGSTTSNSPQVSTQNLIYDSDNSDLSHLLTRPSDVMMSGVFGGVPGQRYQDGRFVVEAHGPMLIGPPEAFYAFTSIRADGTPDDDSDDEFDTEEEFDDDCDILTAFLDMDDYDDNEELAADEEESTSPAATDALESTHTQKGHSRNISEALMRNFDRGIVSSFRNNQDRYRQVSKLPHDMGSMSAPVRHGKTAEDLMTPPRKRKRSSTHDKVPRHVPLLGGFN